jgi:glycosyltransferase involved in cell wall biosynthesis
MRVLIVSDAWYPQVNGVVRTLTAMRDTLIEEGHEAFVLGPDSSHITTVPCPTYPEIRLALNPGHGFKKIIKEFRPNAIHIATEGPLGWAARHYCLFRGLPFTTSFHTMFPDYIKARFGFPRRFTYAYLRAFHKPATRTMVNTQAVEDVLRGRGFEHLVRWTRGVDTNLFKPFARDKADTPTMTYVGRVAVEKNLEAFLNVDVPGKKVIVGDGPDRARLEKKYPEAIFTGAKHGQDLVDQYNAADVFVFPSKTDTFGIVMLEAMACGTPVAAYPVIGPVDVIKSDKVGCLNEDLKTAIEGALKLRRVDCRQYALNQSWQNSAKQFLCHLQPLGVTEKRRAFGQVYSYSSFPRL